MKTAIKILRHPPQTCVPKKLWEGVGRVEKTLKKHITARQTVERHNKIYGVIAAFKNSSRVELN